MARDGTLIFDTEIDSNEFKSGISELKGLAGGAGKAIVATFAAAGAGIGAAAKVGMDFEASMSQVAATMGMTSAEIAAGSKDYELLSKAAQDAGATTKYSASEAAEALNYLALAGYDAEKAASVLPDVLNLAAAGGMDLAYASDLATDAMAALGIEATSKNLTHFGDELSRTAQKSNTSVSQLGEAILVCAGTAKNSGQSLETLNTALGVMANRGIKGSEGGTHLRNVLLSLTAGTDQAKKALKNLGVAVADGNGNIRSLDDILVDLKKSLSGMNEEAKVNKLSEIFNKTDISAINALLDGMGDEWNNLKQEVSSADGAMADMAETMSDNLKGRMDELSSALEATGIAVYNGIQGPLKETVESVTENVSNLAASFNSGELSGALSNIGVLMGTLAGTITNVLGGAAKGVIKILSALGSNIEIVSGLVAGAVAGFAAFKILSTITTLVGGLKVAFVKLTAVMMANPWVAVATAIVGIGVAVATTAKNYKEAYKATEEYKKSTEGIREKVDEARSAIDELKKSQAEKVQDALYDVEKVQRYADELRTLADANGKVADSDRTRAQFLLGELNNALGTEYSMQGNIIQQYGEMGKSINELIQKKRVMTILEAGEEDYNEALKNRSKGYETYGNAVNNAAAKQQELNKYIQETEATYGELFDESGNVRADLPAPEFSQLTELREELKLAVEEKEKAYAVLCENTELINAYDNLGAAANGTYDEMIAATMEWEMASKAASDEAEKDATDMVKTYSDAISTAVGTVSGFKKDIADGVSGANAGMITETDAQLKALIQKYKLAGGDIKALEPVFSAAGLSLGEYLGESTAQGVEANAGNVTAAANAVATQAGASATATAQSSGTTIGSTVDTAAAQAITGNSATVTAATNQVVSESASAATSAAQNTGTKIGNTVGDSAATSITSSSAAVSAATNQVVSESASAASTTAQTGGNEAGSALTQSMASGITSGAGAVSAAATGVIQNAAATAGASASAAGSSIGANLATGIAAGIVANSPAVSAAAAGAVRNAVAAAQAEGVIKSPSRKMRDKVGKPLAEGVAVGIENKTKLAVDASRKMTEAVINASKSAADINSPSRITRDEVGAMLVEGIYVGVKSKIDKVPELFEKLMEDIQLQLDLGAISEADYYKKVEEYRNEYLKKGSDEWWNYTKEIIGYENRLAEEQRDSEFSRLENLKEIRLISEAEYYEKLRILRDEYFAEDSDEWWEYTKEISGYEQSLAEEQRDREFKKLESLKSLRIISETEYYKQLEKLRDKYFEKGSAEWEDYTLEIAQYYSDAFMSASDVIIDKQEGLKDKLLDAKSLYTTMSMPLVKDGKVMTDVMVDFNVLTDLQPYIDGMKDYTDVLSNLKKRQGMSKELMDEIANMDIVAGKNVAQQLLKLSDSEFKKYIDGYTEYITEAEKISGIFYSEERDEVVKSAESFGQAFKEGLSLELNDIDEVMSQIGYDGASAFAREFKVQIASAMREFATSIVSVIPSSTGGNNQYNTYQLMGSGETVSEQLRACRNDAKIEQLRGGYS